MFSPSMTKKTTGGKSETATRSGGSRGGRGGCRNGGRGGVAEVEAASIPGTTPALACYRVMLALLIYFALQGLEIKCVGHF